MRLVVFYCIKSSCPFKLNDEKRLAHRTYRLLVDGELCGGSEFEPHLDLAALYNWCVFDECWLTIQSTFVMGLAGWRKMCWVSTFSFRDSEKALAFSLSPYDPKSVNRAKNDAKRCKIQLTFQKYTSGNDSINNKRVIKKNKRFFVSRCLSCQLIFKYQFSMSRYHPNPSHRHFLCLHS